MGSGWRTGRELHYFHDSCGCSARHAARGVIPHGSHHRASAGELKCNQSKAPVEQWGLQGLAFLCWFVALKSYFQEL